MLIKGLVDEDFVNYKKVSMFISTSYCDWKCCTEANIPIEVCQNCSLAKEPTIDISTEKLYERYINNPITSSIVIGGLEPVMQKDEVLELIDVFRGRGCEDDIVIYTGYEPYEIQEFIDKLKTYNNIYVKFGRFRPDEEFHYDEVLGVKLCSSNQRGIKIC